MKNSKIDSKVFVPLLLSVIILAVIFASVFLYNEYQPEGDMIQGLTEFYENDFYNLLDYQRDQICVIEMKVWTVNSSVLINSSCIAQYPYSALEAFMSVARGDIGSGEDIYYTNLDWNMSEGEALETRLKLLLYPFEQMCSLPCLDDNLPYDIDVIDVGYEPEAGKVSEMFRDYSLENFAGTVFKSHYRYVLHYEDFGNTLKWKYLLGWGDQGNFVLKIDVDKPISNLKSERVLETQGKGNEYVLNKTGESSFTIRGFTVGTDMLVVEW